MNYFVDQSILIKFLLPSSKRTTLHVKWLESLNSQMFWSNQNLVEYVYGSIYPIYATGSSYSTGDRVVGGLDYNNAVYESIVDSNIGLSLGSTASWQLVNNNFIGVSERALYSSNKLNLEWNLNRYYHTTFRQPDGVTSSTNSDIYISDTNLTISPFILGDTELSSSRVFDFGSSGYILDGTFAYMTYQYTIWIPTAVFSAIPGTESNVRNYVDRYNTAGIYYNVSVY